MLEVGRVVVKIAGRDAGKRAVIVDVLDNQYVLIEGETRRRKCNVRHLELLDEMVKVSKAASHEAVCKALGIEITKTKPKEKKKKPVKIRGKKKVVEKPKKKASKAKKEVSEGLEAAVDEEKK